MLSQILQAERAADDSWTFSNNVRMNQTRQYEQ